MKKAIFGYLGGKSQLAKHIIPLIPEHTCYVEPFCEATWVFFKKNPSKGFWKVCAVF
jgi:DNA adenine methylase